MVSLPLRYVRNARVRIIRSGSLWTVRPDSGFPSYRFDGLEYDSQTSIPGNGRARVREFLQTMKGPPRRLLQMRRGGDFLASYDAEWNHFLNAIHHDTPVECTLEDGRRALQIVLAAIASATLGRSVPIT